MKYLWIILASTFLISSNTYALGLKNIEEVELSASHSMAMVQKGQLNELFESLKSIWPIPVAEIDVAKDQTLSQRTMVSSRFGKTIGIKHVSTEILADTILKIIYIEKFERHIIRWQFFYYKPNNEWVLNTFVWDDQIKSLFK